MALELIVHEEEAYVALELNGDLDTDAEKLPHEVARLAREHGTPVVIDLIGVRLTTSMGVGMLVEAYKAARRAGIRILFTGIQPQVRTVLAHTKLDTVFEIVKDRAAAAASISS